MNSMSEKHPKEDLIGALVLKAKNGESGEKENALRTLKKLCAKYDMDFDSVMNDGDLIQEYRMMIKPGEVKVARQIIARYGLIEKHPDVYALKHGGPTGKIVGFSFTTSKEKYIETINAYEVLMPQFKKEKKKMQESLFMGFVYKHNLYPQFRIGDGENSDEDFEAHLRGMRMARDMDDVDIQKRLSGPSS